MDGKIEGASAGGGRPRLVCTWVCAAPGLAGLRWPGSQGHELTPQSVRLTRHSLLEPVALTVARGPESAPYPACAVGVFPRA